jgi:hypothetical protein
VALDAATEGDLPIPNRHLHVSTIELAVLRELLADVLADPLV